MSSEGEFGEDAGEKVSEHSSILSFMAATWDYYGGMYIQ